MSEFKKLEENRPILCLLLEGDDNFEKKENIFFAEKAFFANSLIQRCIDNQREGIISYEQFKAYMLILDKYVKKEVDLFWDDDILHVKIIEDHYEEGGVHASDDLESTEQ